MTNKQFRVGFDIGGTFTDFVLVDAESGQVLRHKCLTTPDDPVRAVMRGLKELLAKVEASGADLEIALHGTTLITNAIIERKGAKTAMVATEGFRDVLIMGKEVRYDTYDLFLEKPEPLVPRNRSFEVTERLDKDGNVIIPLSQASLEATVSRLKNEGVESVAVVLLHSFTNGQHEQAVRSRISESLPNATVSISSEVAPEIREFERMSTTVANAYVQPITKAYLDRLQASLSNEGYSRDLLIMLSSGGVTTNETAKEFPIRLVESGPAAGTLATVFLGKQCGLDSVIAFDMGGTTAKISVVQKGNLSMVNTMEVARTRRFKKGSGIPIQIPAIEMVEIGAGGGSIAHVDSLGLLKVGPESAGADPGPACYGLGGVQPTVTDAAVVLGILNPKYFLGGQMDLYADRAKEAIRTGVANPLGISMTDAARGIFEVVNENMASALKTHVAERGEDPRRAYLVAFGGAGPVHGYELARGLGMRGVIVPMGAGTMSAQGLLTTPVSFEFARSLYSQLDRVDPNQVLRTFTELETKGREVLARAGITSEEDITVRYSMDLRHRGQGYEITVDYPKDVINAGDYPRMSSEFYRRYRDKYGHAHEHLPVELVTCRLLISGPTPQFNLQSSEASGFRNQDALRGRRQVYFVEAGGYVETPIYDRYRLAPGVSLLGPAVIEERESTIALGPGSQIAVDRYLNVIATINR